MDEIKYLKKMNISFKIILSISLICILILSLFCSTYYLGGYYLYEVGLATKMKESANKFADRLYHEYEMPENDTSWIADAVTNDEISLAIAKSDIDLYAVKFTASTDTHVWIITLHGYRSSWTEMAGCAIEFHNHGYNVLMPSLRGQGITQYPHLGMGYFDRVDIIAWIDYIIGIDAHAEIILHGRSMGGAAVMMVTGEELPSNVKCAIEDCGYTNVYDQFKHVIRNVLKIPFADYIMFAGDAGVKRRIGISLKDMDSVAQLKKSVTPTLFIHGKNDSFVPFWMLDILYNANDTIYKEKLELEGAEHAMSSTIDHDLYFNTIYSFADQFIS